MTRHTKLLITLGALSVIALYMYRKSISVGVKTMTDKFLSAVKQTFNFEGGFQADPNDKGNWTGGKIGVGELKGTKFGISAATYPKEDIRQLTRERALELYKRDFWLPSYDSINSTIIAMKVFDMSVNMGPTPSHKILQRAVGVLDDGKIGPKTLQAVNAMNPDILLSKVKVEARKYYDSLLSKNRNLEPYRASYYERAAWPSEAQKAKILQG